MADHDNRWREDRRWDRDERSQRRSGGERDFYRRDEYGEDDYGRGYGEEGLTNYRLRGSGPGGSAGGYGSGYGGYGGSDREIGGGYPRNYSRGAPSPRGFSQSDFASDFSSDFGSGSRGYHGRNESGRSGRDWDDQGRGRIGSDRHDDRGLWDRATDEVSSWFGDDDAERRRREDARQDMRHQGRGPKGYRRSDERIREDVSDRLTDDPFIDASEIEIAVSNAEVTLTGSVESRGARRRAEDLAERVSGVTHVQNNLRVTSGAEGTRQESESGRSKGVFSKS